MRITIHVGIRERAAEPALLFQSLRTQTYKKWDLVILDSNSQPIENNHFVMCIVNRIKLENHYVNIIRDDNPKGVCSARNQLVTEDYFNNELICRLDDDVVLETDYLGKLINVIKKGYDIASGITPLMTIPEFKRNINKVLPIMNLKEFDKKNNLVKNIDDCGMAYTDNIIAPAHEFRSNALMKRKVARKIKYEKNLSDSGFREEAFFSLRALWHGYKIGIDTSAIAYHIQCPIGGVRAINYQEKIISDDKYFTKWAKKMRTKHGNLPNYRTKKD